MRVSLIFVAYMVVHHISGLKRVPMDLAADPYSVARDRVTRVFRYLQGLDQLRNPPVLRVAEQPWVLWLKTVPEHPLVECVEIRSDRNIDLSASKDEQPEVSDDFILKVSRPSIPLPPEPPPELAKWLRHGWDSIDGTVDVHMMQTEIAADGREVEIKFTDDPMRDRMLTDWKKEREDWERKERPTHAAWKLFERLYELYTQIEREAERIELVLGDGILSWHTGNEELRHPLILQRLQLQFDPAIPRFKLRESDSSVELYAPLLRAVPGIDGQLLREFRDELDLREYHPLDTQGTSDFLHRLVVQLSPRGEFAEPDRPYQKTSHPVIHRDPVIFLRARTLGFSKAIESILEDLPARKEMPTALRNIVGLGPATAPNPHSSEPPSQGEKDVLESVLFTKAANNEQFEIARALESHESVLAQGPPGTGKTHTIANLLGHLLAQGKSVLVTSHTSKALRILRDQVARELQPLCVSLLESDVEGRQQLERSVTAISERLSSTTFEQQEFEAHILDRERRELLARLAQARRSLLLTVTGEYEDIKTSGSVYSPAEAARCISRGIGKHDWIPGPIRQDAQLPLSPEELRDLYRTNEALSTEDEREIQMALPSTQDLVDPHTFEQLANESLKLRKSQRDDDMALWDRSRSEASPEELESALKSVTQAVERFPIFGQWQLEAMDCGRKGGIHRQAWEHLANLITGMCEDSIRVETDALDFDLELSGEIPVQDQVKILDEIIGHLRARKTLNRLTLLGHAHWRRLIEVSRLEKYDPIELQHFEALRRIAALEVARADLARRWERFMIKRGAPPIPEPRNQPERFCEQFVDSIREGLSWYREVWLAQERILEAVGFKWSVFLSRVIRTIKEHTELLRLHAAVAQELPRVFQARINALRFSRVEPMLSEFAAQLSQQISGNTSTRFLEQLLKAAVERSVDDYRKTFERIVELTTRRDDLLRRNDLIARLDAVAPGWANAVRNRRPPNHGGDIPGDVEAAWVWRQLYDALGTRAGANVHRLHSELTRLTDELQRTTTALVDRRAWASQVRRTTHQQRQALMGWLHTIRKIGAGTGRRVPQLRAQARQLMTDCRSAVPVWIMPLTRVLETFTPNAALFDVLIMDEASQSDVMGLIALYLARQAIIVGDHEQVSPEAVGQDLSHIQSLINEHLAGVPNKQLYDGRTSIYDLAMQSFGVFICLLEHFRCVPEIIQFSNMLSYGGRIRPLRDASHIATKPPVVSCKVNGIYSESGINMEEALLTASLLAAATKEPEYRGKSFGVISLVGEEQAYQIEALLRQHITPIEFETRRIVCGNAAQFQGDERDVMFLSVVDSASRNRLPLRAGDMFRKRFNVAASRARDQMWVIHSLEPSRDLRPDDLRRQLIEYAENPGECIPTSEDESRPESELERRVKEILEGRGCRVSRRWKVGYYVIDLVVESDDTKLAIECEGDRSISTDRLHEKLGREVVLERIGWRFVRVRASEFFRDQGFAMSSVFEALDELGIRAGRVRVAEPKLGVDLISKLVQQASLLRQSWGYPNVEANVTSLEQVHGRNDTVVTKIGSAEVGVSSVRELRSADEISVTSIRDAEIRAAILECLPYSGEIEHNHLLLSAARWLGVREAPNQLRVRLEQALDAERLAGKIETVTGVQKHRRAAQKAAMRTVL